MIFTDLAAGASLFVDTNTLVYHFQPHAVLGQAATDLLERIENQEITGFTSTHVLDRIAHVMTLEACALFGWPYVGIAQRLRQHPAQVQTLSRFRLALQEVPRYGIHVLTVPAALIDAAAAISQQTGLLANDALIVSLMQANGLTNLASHDADFDRVPGIIRYSPC